MSANLNKYDPWGPISAILFEANDSDLVQTIIDSTGVAVKWPELDAKTGASHLTRIRAFRPAIQDAYASLANEERGRFAQNVAKRLKDPMKLEVIASLHDIGWEITESGVLTTQDALMSEQFFPAGTPYDAYLAVRSILEQVSNQIMIVDPFIGGTIFATLTAACPQELAVKVLTRKKALKEDFTLEAQKFAAQFPKRKVEIRTAEDFHDRFIMVDEADYYHVGASIKDAGTRAFLLSKLQDQPIIAMLKQYIGTAWNSAAKAEVEESAQT